MTHITVCICTFQRRNTPLLSACCTNLVRTGDGASIQLFDCGLWTTLRMALSCHGFAKDASSDEVIVVLNRILRGRATRRSRMPRGFHRFYRRR